MDGCVALGSAFKEALSYQGEHSGLPGGASVFRVLTATFTEVLVM
jgi:hypothetical protein